MKNTMLLALAVAGMVGLAADVSAGGAVMPPKAKELAMSLRTVPGTTPDVLDRSVIPSPPKTLALAGSLRTVSGRTPDLLERSLKASSAKALIGKERL